MIHQTHEQIARRQAELASEHDEAGSVIEAIEIGVLSASVRDPRSSPLQDQAVCRARNAAEKKLASAPANNDRLSCIEATIRACEQAGLKSGLPEQKTLAQLNAEIQLRRDAEERERLRKLLGF